MLQFRLFLVLKEKIFQGILYRSKLLCLEEPLHIFYHYITGYNYSRESFYVVYLKSLIHIKTNIFLPVIVNICKGYLP